MTPDQIIDSTVSVEGGYSNNPSDRGGETKFGITSAVARAYGYTAAMTDMPRPVALVIYKKLYWTQAHLDAVYAINSDIAAELFDTGVNMGVLTAGKFLQEALNVLGSNTLAVDGVVGAVSAYALKSFLATRGPDGVRVILNMLNAQQCVRYMDIAKGDPSQRANEFGWQRLRVKMS